MSLGRCFGSATCCAFSFRFRLPPGSLPDVWTGGCRFGLWMRPKANPFFEETSWGGGPALCGLCKRLVCAPCVDHDEEEDAAKKALKKPLPRQKTHFCLALDRNKEKTV